MSDDDVEIDLEDGDDHYSDPLDLSDIDIKSHRNKTLTYISISIKSHRNISNLRLYGALGLFMHRLGQEIGISAEDEGEH